MHLPLLFSFFQFFRTYTGELVSFRKPDALLALVEPNKTPTGDVNLDDGHLWLNSFSGQLHFRHLHILGYRDIAGRPANSASHGVYGLERAYRDSFGIVR